jgi:hypothetical protein
MTSADNCGRCGATCSEQCIEGQCCPRGYGVCWGECVSVRDDARHCGACGRACAFDQACRDGVCVRSSQPTGGCNAQSVRLWLSAFVPGRIAGMTFPRTIVGDRRDLPSSVYLPLPAQAVGAADQPRCSDLQLCLSTDRPPDPRADQDWRAFFSSDPSAPSLAHAEIEIDLQTMRAGWQPPAAYDAFVQIVDADDGGVNAVTGCRNQIVGDDFWFGEPEPIEKGVRLPIAATWNMSEASPAANGSCPIDALAISPLGTALGAIEIQVLADDGVVRVSVPELDLPRFPVFEIYAALDDGHVVRVWAGDEPPVPLSQVNATPATAIADVAVDLPCGCGPCRGGETCDTDGSCVPLDGYFVLSGSSRLDLTQPICPYDAAMDIPADGLVNVFLNGQPVYEGRAGATCTPPIGFRARTGDNLQIRIEGWGPAAGYQAGPLYLHRVDTPFAISESPQVLEGSQFPLPHAETYRIGLARATAPGGMCQSSGPGTPQFCVDVLADAEQCGGFDARGTFACGETEVCLNGVCECPTPRSRVGLHRCADLLWDRDNCGVAGFRCPTGDICTMGHCMTPD